MFCCAPLIAGAFFGDIPEPNHYFQLFRDCLNGEVNSYPLCSRQESNLRWRLAFLKLLFVRHTTHTFYSRCLTTWPLLHRTPGAGLEPTTTCLEGKSLKLLCANYTTRVGWCYVLYQLSYPGLWPMRSESNWHLPIAPALYFCRRYA